MKISLRAFYDRNSDLVAAHVYMALPNDPDFETPLHPLMKYLGFNGFITHPKYVDIIPANGDRPARITRPNLATEVMAGVIENLDGAKHNPIERLVHNHPDSALRIVEVRAVNKDQRSFVFLNADIGLLRRCWGHVEIVPVEWGGRMTAAPKHKEPKI